MKSILLLTSPLSRYIGKPWVAGTFGPDSYDCWGLLWTLYREQFDIELPKYPNIPRYGYDVSPLSQDWTKLAKPVDFCGVGLSHLPDKIYHVGVFLMIDGGLVMHTQQNTGCIIQPLTAVMRRWQHVSFYALHNNSK